MKAARNKKQQPLDGRQLALLVIILLAAALLRMGQPGLVEFKRDEAQLFSLALDMAEFQSFHVRGISSSVGFPNFPMSVWLYALPLLAWKHVYGAILFTGLVNTAAVFGCWWLARRYWGLTAAFAAALLFAFSPWAVFHSQKIWAQNLLPPLVVGWAIGAGLAFVERRPRFIILHLVCLAVALQVHLAAIALVPVTLLFMIVFRERISWRLVILGGALALLTAVPFLNYLLSTAGSVASAVNAAGGIGQGFNLLGWRYSWLLISGQEIHSLAGQEHFRAYLDRLPGIGVIFLLWGGLALAGMGWIGRQWWFKWRDRSATIPGRTGWEMPFIVLAWSLGPPLLFTLPFLPVELHYLLPIYPAPYIAAGVLFAALLEQLPRWRATGWGVLVFSAVVQGWAWLALLALVGQQNTPGGYGTPVRFHLQAAEDARALLERQNAGEVIIAGRSERPEEEEFAAVYDVLLRNVPHRFVDSSHSALFPADGAVVLINHAAFGPAVQAYLEAAISVRRLPLRADEGVLQLATLPAGSAPLPEISPESTILFSNWIEITGYDPLLPQPVGTALWTIYWHPGANPDPADYHFFNHLLNESGERVGQEDAAVFAPWQWQAGDTVISFFYLNTPEETAGPLTMRTGVYRYPSLENVPLLDAAGNPAGEAVEFEAVSGSR
jgi:hypothetical protein